MPPRTPSMTALPAVCAPTTSSLQPHRPLHARARVPAALHRSASAGRSAQPFGCPRPARGAVRCTAQVATADLAVGETRVASSGAVEGCVCCQPSNASASPQRLGSALLLTVPACTSWQVLGVARTPH